MRRQRSLRQLLLVGTTAFAVAAGGLMVGILVLVGSLQRVAERDARARLAEQQAADEIVTAVYGQILAAYQQLQSPSERNLKRFNALGQTTFSRLREYLFQPMPLEARLQVETIKELHQTLEVEAHAAFDLGRGAESQAARVRVAEMQRRAERLQVEMNRFVALRERERAHLRQKELLLFRRLLTGMTLVAAALIALAALFVRLVQRRVVLPLGQLAEAAARLGSGDLAARIPPQRHAELETVARRFNGMADSIQEAHAEVENRNRELSAAIGNLRRTQQDLVQQEKLGAIGFMLAGLAHELNNPLAGILGSAECIEQELAGHTDPAIRRVVRELVAPLITEAARAGDLVRNLLLFSRPSNAQLAAVNLRTAIDVARGLRAYAYTQAGMMLLVAVPDGLYVAVEEQRLEHVAMNVMSNALEAMRAGGGTKLEVRAERIDSGWVALTFEDDGPGFREPDRVFDAFYTTKPVGSGTGLGLSLVQRFVSEAGGTIAAENAPSGGARLTMRLRAASPPFAGGTAAVERAPAAPEARGASLPAHTPEATSSIVVAATHVAAGQRRGLRRILVVDDEPAIREIQRRFLEKAGIEVLVAKDGAEAVAVLERERCDAVITDIRMPGEIDGIALYRWIEAAQPDLAKHCLFVTGEIEPDGEDPVTGILAGRAITKPFKREAYVARVLALLDDAAPPA